MALAFSSCYKNTVYYLYARVKTPIKRSVIFYGIFADCALCGIVGPDFLNSLKIVAKYLIAVWKQMLPLLEQMSVFGFLLLVVGDVFKKNR